MVIYISFFWGGGLNTRRIVQLTNFIERVMLYSLSGGGF